MLLPNEFALRSGCEREFFERWGRGYGVFSVSHSGAAEVAKYIANQEEHHRKRSFAEELKLLVERHGLEWRDDKTAQAVPMVSSPAAPPPR